MSDSSLSVGSPGFASAYVQAQNAQKQEVAVLKLQQDNQKQEGEAAMKLLSSTGVVGPNKVDINV